LRKEEERTENQREENVKIHIQSTSILTFFKPSLPPLITSTKPMEIKKKKEERGNPTPLPPPRPSLPIINVEFYVFAFSRIFLGIC